MHNQDSSLLPGDTFDVEMHGLYLHNLCKIVRDHLQHSAIKDGLSGRDQIGKMLIKIFEDYNNNVKSLIGIDYSESTLDKIRSHKTADQRICKMEIRRR